MKKIAATVIASLFILSFTACGASPSSDGKAPASSDTPASTSASSASEAPSKEEATPPEKLEESISETVLLEEDGVKITAKSLEKGSLFGPEIKLLIENDSGKDLVFQCRSASVNGYMVDTSMSVEVMNGKKANDALTLMDSSLKDCGIETIADMEFSFYIFTVEDWQPYLTTPQIQLKTTAADTYEYTFDDSGEPIYEGNGVKIVVKGLAEDSSIFGPSIKVYIENNSEKEITIQTRDVSINGFMVDAVFSSEVVAGKHAVDTITFMDTQLQENEITEIESVELSFHIFESDGWSTITDTDPVTITL